MESAVSFAPLRPTGFVNFTGRGRTGQGVVQPIFPWGGAGQASPVL